MAAALLHGSWPTPRSCGPRLLRAALLAALLLTVASPALADPVDDYNVAAKFYKDKQWEHAEEAFARFVKQYPAHDRAAAAQLYQGQSLVHLRKFASARDVFRSFVERFPQYPDAYLAVYRVGECSYFLGDYRAARTELDQFISAYPKHALAESALQFLAESQLRLEDPAGAVSSLQLQLERFPEGRYAEEGRFLLGRAQLQGGDKAAALATFQKLAESESGAKAADALVEAGLLLYDARQFGPARDAFAAVRTRFPHSPLVPTADLNAGYSCYHLEEYDTAMAHFRRAEEAPTQAHDAAFWVGMSQKSAGDHASAAQTLQKLAESATEESVKLKARFHWADAELRNGRHQAAQTQFLAVVQADPKGPLAADALHLATEAAVLAKDYDEADRLVEQFRQSYPESGLWLLVQLQRGRSALARGDLAFDSGDTEAAEQNYRRAASEFSDVANESRIGRTSAFARLMWGRALDRLEQYAELLTALAPLVDELKQPENEGEFAEALVLMARAGLRENKPQVAADAAQLFVDRYNRPEQSAEALATLALARSRLNQPAETEATIDRLWESDVDALIARRTTYQLAEQAYNAKDWPRAAHWFQRLLDGGAGEFQTASLSGLGYSLYESQQYEPAAKVFEKLVETGASGRRLAADAAQMRALALRQAGQPDAAVEAYESALRQFARAADAEELSEEELQVVAVAFQCAKGLARVRKELQQVEQADRAYAVAVEQLELLPREQQQELDQLIHEWALLHYALQDYDRADKLFERLMAARPDSSLADDARLYVGESHFFAQRLDPAREVFAALSKDEKADDFVRQRALVLLLDVEWEQHDWAAVAATARTLVEKYPQGEQRAYAEYRLGEALIQQGRTTEAIETLSPLVESSDEAVRKAEWFSGARLLLAEAQLQGKKYTALEETVKRFREEDPDSPLLYQADEILGRRFKNEARWDEARTALKRAIDSEQGRRTETAAKAQLLLAETYLLEQKDSEAVAEYYKVFLNYNFPDYQAPALFQAAQCDERLKRWSSAVKTYEELIENFPDHEYAKKAQPALEAARKRLPAESPPADVPLGNTPAETPDNPS